MNTMHLKRRLGVPESRPVADFHPTISIKLKILLQKDEHLFEKGQTLDMYLWMY